MGLARSFNGGGERVLTAAGSIVATGAMTQAVLTRKPAGTDALLSYKLGIVTSAPAVCTGLSFDTSNQVGWLPNGISGGLRTSTTTVLVSDGWVIIVVSKPAGTSTCRAHIYKGGVWTHEDMSGGTIASQSGTPAEVQFGYFLFGYDTLEIAAAGHWDSDLTDAQVEEYISWERATQWRGAAAAWDFDQASVADPVLDATGGSADQTEVQGSTVITDGPDSVYYQTGQVTDTIDSATGLILDVLLVPDG
jgi:hypothetical protein